MKYIPWTIAALFALAAPAMAQEASKDDVIKLARAGISDGVIVAFLDARGGVPLLTADDIVELKSAGVSDTVIAHMMTTAPPPRSTSEKTRVVTAERPSATGCGSAGVVWATPRYVDYYLPEYYGYSWFPSYGYRTYGYGGHHYGYGGAHHYGGHSYNGHHGGGGHHGHR